MGKYYDSNGCLNKIGVNRLIINEDASGKSIKSIIKFLHNSFSIDVTDGYVSDVIDSNKKTVKSRTELGKIGKESLEKYLDDSDIKNIDIKGLEIGGVLVESEVVIYIVKFLALGINVSNIVKKVNTKYNCGVTYDVVKGISDECKDSVNIYKETYKLLIKSQIILGLGVDNIKKSVRYDRVDMNNKLFERLFNDSLDDCLSSSLISIETYNKYKN